MGKQMPPMGDEERKAVCAKLEWEGGLEYLIGGSNFPEIKDERFHKLREDFVKAANALTDYLRYNEYAEESGGLYGSDAY